MGERYAFASGEDHSVLIDDPRNEPTSVIPLINSDGVALDSSTTHVRRLDPGLGAEPSAVWDGDPVGARPGADLS